MSIIHKIILTILTIATIVAAGLWLAGGKKNDYSAAIQINSTPEQIFPYLTDPEKMKIWLTGLNYVERLESNKDENGRSARRRTQRIYTIDGRESRFEDEVIRFEQDKAVSVQSTNANLVKTSIFRLEPIDDATNLTYRVTITHCGIGRLLAPFQTDSTQKQIDDDIRLLKERIEATAQ